MYGLVVVDLIPSAERETVVAFLTGTGETLLPDSGLENLILTDYNVGHCTVKVGRDVSRVKRPDATPETCVSLVIRVGRLRGGDVRGKYTYGNPDSSEVGGVSSLSLIHI